ncbi:hypothetical protein H4582DRAFT_2012615 [Lactarius indigo]|nr:hypothetical protein H4582DRAFT_2012615 [Lactarius indigo]
MFKAIKHLSMNGMLLKALQNANFIQILTRNLDEQRSRAQNLAARYVDQKFGFVPVLVYCFLFAGNIESYLPDVLQHVSIEQGKRKRSRRPASYRY